MTLHGAAIIGSLGLAKGWLTEEVTNCTSDAGAGGGGRDAMTREMESYVSSKWAELVNSSETVASLLLQLPPDQASYQENYLQN